jgi:hypothetical protein
VIARSPAHLGSLGHSQRHTLSTLESVVLAISDTESESTFRDVNGEYATWLDSLGAAAIIVRPDFYVYGYVTEASELPSLVDGLADELRLNRQYLVQ